MSQLDSRPDFIDALRLADRELADSGIPSLSARRLQRRFADPPSSRSPYRLPLAFGLCVAVVALLLTMLPVNSPMQPDNDALLLVTKASVDLQLHHGPTGQLSIQQGHCVLTHSTSGIQIYNRGKLVIEGLPDGLRLLDGSARFVVDKRDQGQPPARIQVSGGVIEVLGTEFAVSQRGLTGMVILHEGVIRFVPIDGDTKELRPGQTLLWPEETQALPVPDPVPVKAKAEQVDLEQPRLSTPKPNKPPIQQSLTVHELEEENQPPSKRPSVLSKLATLRSRRKFQQAAELLEETLRRDDVDHATREQLSYELALILGDQLRDTEASCKHWAFHMREFSDGRFSTEARSAQKRLGCGKLDTK